MNVNVLNVEQSTKEVCQLASAFFTLTNEYINKVYRVFLVLMKNYGWSFTELYCLPVSLRTWIVNQTSDMMKEANNQ